MQKIFMSKENSKTNEPHKFVLNFSQILRLGLRVQIIMLFFKTYLFITCGKR